MGVVVAAALTLVFAASASANIDASHTALHIATAGDCNGNGVLDVNEASWANRDDDGDGFCNGIDVCPYEASTTNDGSACEMQAITIPFRPSDPSVPHPTYSGATITLKGIARYGGNQYSWDYGDGSAPMAWTAISNAYDLGVRHAYTGGVGHLYIATLSVRDSANPSVVSTATYPVQIYAGTDLSDNRTTDVRARMAVDEALWYLHVNESRSTYGDGSPGYQQRFGWWSAGSVSDACVAINAFEDRGSGLAGSYDTDPYVEDVQRALDYVLYNSYVASVGTKVTDFGSYNPDLNGNGIGVQLGGQDDTYVNGVCAIALADSGTPARIAPVGASGIYDRSFAGIAQDTADWFAWGQDDFGYGNPSNGAWGYHANYGGPNGETDRWPMLALTAAQQEMGVTVALPVRQLMPYFLNYSHNTTNSTSYGGWGWEAPTQYPAMEFTAAGILKHLFLGDNAQNADVIGGLGYLYRHWNDPPATGSLFGNLGDSDAMWTVMRALTAVGAARVTDEATPYAPSTGGSFDWYYTPPGQAQTGYAGFLIPRQNADGSWNLFTNDAHSYSLIRTTAQDAMVLMKGAQAQGPIASVGGPYVTDVNTPTTLDATGSIGSGLTYSWDLNGDGAFGDATGPTATMQWSTYSANADGSPNGVVHQVCVRVTDATHLSDTACTNITVKPPPHPPTASAGGPYTAALGHAVTFDASGSFDIDKDPITFAWDFHNAGTFTDATGANPTYTFAAAGTYVVCVRVTDHPDLNAVPYNAPSSTATACTTVEVGVHAPTASAGGPYTSIPNNTIQLDASGSSDPDGNTLTYAWDLNGNGLYTDSTAVKPNFTVGNAAPGTTYSVCVKVSNGLKSAVNCSTVKVVDAPQPPIAQVVSPVTYASGPLPVKVTLDGSRSYDLNGAALTYQWTLTDPHSEDALTGATSPMASATFNHYGDYVAHLTVSNGYFSSSADETIHVIDRTPPTISAVSDITLEAGPSTTADVNAWLASATAFDDNPDQPTASLSNDFVAGSGIGGVGVGNTVKVTWTATDYYGNTAQKFANVSVVDRTPPTLTLPGSQTLHATSGKGAPFSWAATATDFVSGSPPVTCTPASGSTFPVGDTTVNCSATDAAGNTATGFFVVTVIGDSTPPVITPTVTGTKGANDWYTSDVAVSWTISDPESAVTDQTGCGDASQTTDTTGTDFTCTATSAGGTSSVTVHVKRDTTPPTITATRTPDGNATTWSSSDVTVTFTCADATSGVASCTLPRTLGEGADQSASGTVIDEAGNTASTTLDHVNVDETAPTLSGAPTTLANVDGWYSGDVMIHWTCADALSGVATCPADAPISGEGKNLTASAHAVDRAGNTADATSGPVNIDRTPPVTSVSAPTGWSNIGANVTFTALDNLSGVATTYYSVDGTPTYVGDSTTIDTDGTHTITYWSVDNAGNVEATRTVTVLVDKTAPTIAPARTPRPNAAGWNNTDVSVGWSCGDATSGVAFCSAVQLLTGEGKAQAVTGTATDNAGNTAQQTVLVSIDKTAPTITAAADRTANAHGWYKADVTVTFTCDDTLSGIAKCPAAVTLHEGKAQSVTGTARDAADNTASASVSGINVDETKPTVTYTGNAHTYTVAQTVSITCTAADPLSGVDSTTCHNLNAPAWTLGLGNVTLSATAIDLAGNVGAGSTSFAVGVTCASLKTLVGQFSSNAGVTSSLQAKIDSICSAPNANAKAGKLGAFRNAVDAQRGKALTDAQADALIRFAAAL